MGKTTLDIFSEHGKTVTVTPMGVAYLPSVEAFVIPMGRYDFQSVPPRTPTRFGLDTGDSQRLVVAVTYFENSARADGLIEVQFFATNAVSSYSSGNPIWREVTDFDIPARTPSRRGMVPIKKDSRFAYYVVSGETEAFFTNYFVPVLAPILHGALDAEAEATAAPVVSSGLNLNLTAPVTDSSLADPSAQLSSQIYSGGFNFSIPGVDEGMQLADPLVTAPEYYPEPLYEDVVDTDDPDPQVQYTSGISTDGSLEFAVLGHTTDEIGPSGSKDYTLVELTSQGGDEACILVNTTPDELIPVLTSGGINIVYSLTAMGFAVEVPCGTTIQDLVGQADGLEGAPAPSTYQYQGAPPGFVGGTREVSIPFSDPDGVVLDVASEYPLPDGTTYRRSGCVYAEIRSENHEALVNYFETAPDQFWADVDSSDNQITEIPCDITSMDEARAWAAGDMSDANDVSDTTVVDSGSVSREDLEDKGPNMGLILFGAGAAIALRSLLFGKKK
jgi:hypothetical protein